MNINDFIQKHPLFTAAADLRTISAPLNLLDITYFSHVHVDSNQQISGLSTSPEYLEIYLKKGHQNHDIHLNNTTSLESYQIWDTVKRIDQSHLLHEDFMELGFGHTFSIIINHGSSKDCYNFATRLGNDNINGKYLSMIDSLKQFIRYFKAKIDTHDELSKAYTAFKLPLKNEIASYLTEKSAPKLNEFKEIIQTNRMYSINNHQYLTKREMECLECLARGKTFEETGIILGISPRTVKAYITSIKEKTGCTSQFQLGMIFSKF